MYLVINLGLKSIRGIIYNSSGKKIDMSSYIIKTHINNNFIEQDANEYVFKLNKILNYFKKNKILSKIKYLSVTSSANCLVGLTKNYKPNTKVFTVLDFRANEILIKNKLKKIEQLDPSHNLSKIIWQKQNDIRVFKNCKYWVNNSDYLCYYLTKNLVTDNLNYNKFLIKNIKVTKKILNSYNIKNIYFPKKKEIGVSIKLNNLIIKKFGFNQNCKFILTTYDAICACLGSINSKNIYHNAAEVSGTVTSIRILSKTKPKKTGSLKISYIPLIDRYLIGLSNNLGGGIIEWYKNFFIKQDYYKDLKKSYFKGMNYFYFFPFIFGDRDLGFRQTSRGIFYGLGSNTNIDDLTKSVIDSAAFTSKYLLDKIQKNKSVKKITSVTLSGGLARLDFLNKIKARLFGVKTFVAKDFESTSLGCLILMLVSQSDKKFEKITKIIKLQKLKETSDNSIISKYEFFNNFIKKNKNLFNIVHGSLIKNKSYKKNL